MVAEGEIRVTEGQRQRHGNEQELSPQRGWLELLGRIIISPIREYPGGGTGDLETSTSLPDASAVTARIVPRSPRSRPGSASTNAVVGVMHEFAAGFGARCSLASSATSGRRPPETPMLLMVYRENSVCFVEAGTAIPTSKTRKHTRGAHFDGGGNMHARHCKRHQDTREGMGCISITYPRQPPGGLSSEPHESAEQNQCQRAGQPSPARRLDTRHTTMNGPTVITLLGFRLYVPFLIVRPSHTFVVSPIGTLRLDLPAEAAQQVFAAILTLILATGVLWFACKCCGTRPVATPVAGQAAHAVTEVIEGEDAEQHHKD